MDEDSYLTAPDSPLRMGDGTNRPEIVYYFPRRRPGLVGIAAFRFQAASR